MRCLIISNGDIQDYSYLKKIVESVNYIICADGGANHLFKIDIIPNIVIGDLDSISQQCIDYYKNNNVKFLVFPKNKDKTDTQLATEFAISLKPSEIILTAVIGSRMDHTISNVLLLKKIVDCHILTKIINEKNEIYLISKKLVVKGKQGDNLSLIPLSKVEGIELKGLQYPLISGEIEFGSSFGISNVFLGNIAQVKITSGLLLVIKAVD